VHPKRSIDSARDAAGSVSGSRESLRSSFSLSLSAFASSATLTRTGRSLSSSPRRRVRGRERDDREHVTRKRKRERERRRSDRADPQYRYTCVHQEPWPRPPTAATSLYYIEIALWPKRTHAFAFHSVGVLLSLFLPGENPRWGPAGPIFMDYLSERSSRGFDLRSRNRARAKFIRAGNSARC